MAERPSLIRVQVCYARPEVQILRELHLTSGATLQEAIQRSGVLKEAPELDISVARVGIFGKLKTLDTPLRDGDRVEIYRNLIADPKETRRRRAEKDRHKKAR